MVCSSDLTDSELGYFFGNFGNTVNSSSWNYEVMLLVSFFNEIRWKLEKYFRLK